jgi:hypothetical protein
VLVNFNIFGPYFILESKKATDKIPVCSCWGMMGIC